MRKILLTVVLMVPAVAAAQNWGPGDRSQSWDLSVSGVYQDGETVGGEGGSSLTVKDTWGFGFGFDYHFSKRFSLGMDLEYIRPDDTLELVEDAVPPSSTTIRHTGYQFNGRVVGTLNLADGPLVPYIDAGLGWTHLDSNVADGPPITGCWWHPWWGYVCSNFYSTFSSTETTYGAGVGLRYEISGGGFIKASYNHWVLSGGGSSGDFDLGSARIEYGWTF